MSDVNATMEALVTEAVAKNAEAVDQLLRVIRPLVVRYCRTRLVSDERANTSADDVAQEVCLAVLRALPGYQEQGKPFLAFVYGIAQHKVIEAHRSAGRDRSYPVEDLPERVDDRDGPEQQALNVSDSYEMAALLEMLPEKQREVLRLRVVVGLSAEETAKAVGSSPGAVRVAQHRALSRVRELVTVTASGIEWDRREAPTHEDGELNWQEAPITGDVELDQLMWVADENLQKLLPAGYQLKLPTYRETPPQPASARGAALRRPPARGGTARPAPAEGKPRPASSPSIPTAGRDKPDSSERLIAEQAPGKPSP